MINPALNKAHKPTKQLWETFGAFDSKGRNALKPGLVRQSSGRSSGAGGLGRTEPAQPLRLRARPAPSHRPGPDLSTHTPGMLCSPRSRHLPGLCFTLTQQQVAKLASLEKSFLRETLRIIISLPQKGGGRLLLLPAISSSFQQM